MLITKIFINDINVGERRREDLGDIDGLAESIRKYGLFHPVIVDDKHNLIAGERRLRACQQLGWTEIDVRPYSELSDDERWEIELEENIRRKDLTPLEVSKQIAKNANKVAPFISATVAEIKAGETRGRKSKGAAPKEDVAKALGVSEGALRNAEQHVEAVTKYPELSVVPTQKGAIEAAKKLDAMPERERNAALLKLATEGKAGLSSIKSKASSKPKPKSASGKYATNLSQIQAFIYTIRAVGAEDLTAGWTERETDTFLTNMRECRDGMSAIVSDLESALGELQRQAS